MICEESGCADVTQPLVSVVTPTRDRLLLLDGRKHSVDETSQLLRSYLTWTDEYQLKRLEGGVAPVGSRFLELEKAECRDSEGVERYAFWTGDDVEIRLHLRALQPLSYPHVSIGISDGRPGNLLFARCSWMVEPLRSWKATLS